jgi:hypothetical protein
LPLTVLFMSVSVPLEMLRRPPPLTAALPWTVLWVRVS